MVVAEPDGTQLGALTIATARKIVWPNNDIPTASFTINGLDDQAALCTELATDLLVYKDSELWFRGRMGASADQVSPAGHTSNMNANGYRAILGRRVVQPTVFTFTDIDQGSIAWELIAAAQAMDGGYLGITPGSIDTGVGRTISFTTGTWVSDAIGQIASLAEGFEWEIDPLLRLNIYSPRRGADTDIVLDYRQTGGGSVASFQRTYDPTVFGNALTYTGATTISPVTVESDELPHSAMPLPGTPGRFELVTSDTTISDSELLGLRANYELSQDDKVPCGYQMVLKSGWWTPEALWNGDTCRLELHSGRINESSRQRVTQVEVDPGDDGGEVVTITTGPIPSDQGTDVEALIRRLTLLELSQS